MAKHESDFDLQIQQRKYDGMFEVVLNVSSVRIGETNKELVKEKKAVDLRRYVHLFVHHSENVCKKWTKENIQFLKKINTLYEVNA